MLKSNLSVLMAERGLKIAKIYEDTGISKTTLMALSDSTGKGVQFDTVDKLCNYLGVTPNEFFAYVPVIWEMTLSKRDDDISDYIVITLKNNKLKKSYQLLTYFKSPDNYDFPIENEKFDLWMKIGLEQSDAYNDDDFYGVIKEFPITFENDFYNEIVDLSTNILKSYIKTGNSISVFTEHGGSFEYMPFVVKKGIKIALHMFEDRPDHEAIRTIILKD